MKSGDKKKNTVKRHSTLAPYANPAEVGQDFLDLHGIPYPKNTPTRPPKSVSPGPS